MPCLFLGLFLKVLSTAQNQIIGFYLRIRISFLCHVASVTVSNIRGNNATQNNVKKKLKVDCCSDILVKESSSNYSTVIFCCFVLGFLRSLFFIFINTTIASTASSLHTPSQCD